MHKIALALSGGGSRCIAQLGVIHYLQERDVKISAISGSSGGAIIAGLYASGMSAMEILEALKGINFKSYLKYNITHGTIYSVNSAIKEFQEIFGKKDIGSFDIPFYCCVVDYESGEVEYKKEGDLVTLMLASSALVPVFAPIEYEGKEYVDGGFCDGMPVYPLKDISDFVISINVNPFFKTAKNSFLSHLTRGMFIMLTNNINMGKSMSDMHLEIEKMGRYSIFDLKNFDLFFEIGYKSAKKYERELDELLYTKD
jgi:NTE family protein